MKLRIDNEAMLEEFFENTRLLGIVASIEQYRFCWHLNQILNFDFRINNSIEIHLNKKTRNYFFPIYQYGEQSGTIKHYLYNNEDDGEYLLPEFRHLDFLWLMKDDVLKDQELSVLMNSIKTIPSVQMVVELTNEKIKNKQHLIF
ncbi:MAG: IPExxxVDY family protein [Bacteroidota bacterium]|nr:IPExxxVDY family protein [Bacteroidota bacterium]HSN09338.1 IPExxxVDY family protein [Hanamia sp.]